MTDQGREEAEPKIIVDSDWKQEAAAEKAKLDEELRDVGGKQEMPQASFVELINMILMQATVSLTGYQTPDGQVLPPDHMAAKHFIDLLEVLKEKTAGNLSDEEQKIIDSVLHEMHMRFVEIVKMAQQQAANPEGTES